jgi:hypothetical protein
MKVIPGFPIFWFWIYMMKVILSIPDEGYFEYTWWRLFWVYLMKVILSVLDEGYFEYTWLRLFQKRVVCTKCDIYMFFLLYNFLVIDKMDTKIMFSVMRIILLVFQ